MSPRERVLTAMDGGEPDRVPCALNFYRVDVASFSPRHTCDEPPVDVEFVQFPVSPEEEELRRVGLPFSGDTRLGSCDQVGTYVRWRYDPQVPDGHNPLSRAASLDELRAFPFPEASGPYAAKGLERQVRELHARGLAAGGNLPHLGGELFEAAWRLRGLENFLFDLIERPEWAHYLLDRLADLARRNAEALARAGVDVLSLDDDVGMPVSMMVSPGVWREFFKPRMAAIIEAAKAIKPDLRVLYHSDGWFEAIVGDLMEIGVNAINPLQPDHMDAVGVRRRFGPGLALWGAVGRQTTFSYGQPEDIWLEVWQRVEELGRSGLILCPAYDIDEPDVPKANVEAFLEAVREFG